MSAFQSKKMINYPKLLIATVTTATILAGCSTTKREMGAFKSDLLKSKDGIVKVAKDFNESEAITKTKKGIKKGWDNVTEDITQLSEGKNPFEYYTPKQAGNTNPHYDSYYGSPKNNARHSGSSGIVNQGSRIQRTYNKPVFRTNAPKRYVVKKGDTLWGISRKFLNNPGHWPEIWDKNQEVQNPHRIYPGDILFIYQGKRNVKVSDGSIVEKIIPQMRIERNGTGKPISTLSPFLSWPKVLDENTIKRSPYIVAGQGSSLLFEEGHRLYVRGLRDRHPGGQYAVYNQGKPLVDPETGRLLGHEVIYTGFVDVNRNGLISSVTVSDSKREIRRGDRLLPMEKQNHQLNAEITSPRHKVRGSVLSLFDAHLISGTGMVVAINKGKRHNIRLGHTVGVYAPGRKVEDPYMNMHKEYKWMPDKAVALTLPPEKISNAIVFKVLDNLSYALVSQGEDTIKRGYRIGNP